MDRDNPFNRLDIPSRSNKPREVGLTMIIDWGTGIAAQSDFLNIGAEFVDLAKFAVGISGLLSNDMLCSKIKLYKQHQIIPFPGGQFLEYAIHHDQTKAFLSAAVDVGYEWIEVSDNVIKLSTQEKSALIYLAREDFNLEVIAEVGSKVKNTSSTKLIADVNCCLDAGAKWVFVEAAELFNLKLNETLIEEIVGALPLDKIIFEIPGPWNPDVHRCDQFAARAWLIERFGSNVNLANVPPTDVLEVETMRRGIGVSALK